MKTYIIFDFMQIAFSLCELH